MIKIACAGNDLAISYKREEKDAWTPLAVNDLNLSETTISGVVQWLNENFENNDVKKIHLEYKTPFIKFVNNNCPFVYRGPDLSTLIRYAENIEFRVNKVNELI